MTEYRNVRPRKGRRVHVSAADDLRRVLCGRIADGYVLADEAATCRTCLSILLERLQ